MVPEDKYNDIFPVSIIEYKGPSRRMMSLLGSNTARSGGDEQNTMFFDLRFLIHLVTSLAHQEIQNL
jgi:hypothetical protein